jgi:serine/threonine-protein kinase RsbW
VPPSSEQDDSRLGFELVLAADWITPSVARDRVRSWLRTHHWSPAHTDDLVLAVNEAVSNSIEHGYGLVPDMATPLDDRSTVEVHARLDTDPDGTRRVEFTIRDRGRWLEPTGGPSTRGHGVRIMRACVENVRIDHGPAGTTVVLHSWPLPRS